MIEDFILGLIVFFVIGCIIFVGIYLCVNENNTDKYRRHANTEHDRKEEYRQLLHDPRWKAFRDFVFKVRGTVCEICGCKKYLQIHHPKYHENCKAWEYSCKEVIVVCRDCHKKIHGIKENIA